MSDILTELEADVRGMCQEAHSHMEQYARRAAETGLDTNADWYWRGRRDEAGWFRDNLGALIPTQLEPPDPRKSSE